jgi:hypothetical protein
MSARFSSSRSIFFFLVLLWKVVTPFVQFFSLPLQLVGFVRLVDMRRALQTPELKASAHDRYTCSRWEKCVDR